MEKEKAGKHLRIGIIGCGKIVLTRHAPEYFANENAEIVGFFDYVRERADKMTEKYGGLVYNSVEEMLADNSIDAVSVCTSNSTHASVAIAAMRAGKHVLCEKPMATTQAECEEMLNVAKATGKRLLIAHNQRLCAPHEKARQLLADGAIGRPVSFKTCFGHSGPDNWSVDAGTGNWFFDMSKSAFGAVADLGIHKIDLMRYLLGCDVDFVQGMLGTLDKCYSDGTPVSVDDNAVILCRMKNGVMGTVTVSWTYYAGEENDTCIYGTEGKMSISPKKEAVTVCDKYGNTVTYDTPQGPTTRVIDTFVNSVLSCEDSTLDADKVYQSMQAMLAAIKSSDEGRRITL